MNLQSTLKTIASFVLLLAALVIHECLDIGTGVTRPSAGSVTAARSSAPALRGGPIGMYRASSDGGRIERKFRADGGPLG